MTEDDARDEVRRIVGQEATDRLARFATLVIAENERQNLIARSTVATIWSRHMLDSIQLLQWAGSDAELWIDIGTGGGFPGLAIAIASRWQVMLVEPRRQRAEFLRQTAATFELVNTHVVPSKIGSVSVDAASVISARAVAPIAHLLRDAIRCASSRTRWLLPRGAGWQSDVALAKADWKGMFHVEQSLSEPSARIVVATQVQRR